MKLSRGVIAGATERVQNLQAPFLSELDGLKRIMTKRGKEIIDLSRFDIRVAMDLPASRMEAPTRSQIAVTFCDYLAKEHGADVDPDHEVLLLPGLRIALLLIGAYFVDSRSICYAPNPGYDAYRRLLSLFGTHVRNYPLYQRNDYLPNLEQFDGKNDRTLKLLIINTPHNPTGAVCDQAFFQQLLKMSAERNILVLVDAAYALPYSGRFQPPLFCATKGCLKVGFELFSFSTNLCDHDLRLTALVGRKTFIEPLKTLANTLGCLPSQADFQAAARYFENSQILHDHLKKCRQTMETRMAVVTDKLRSAAVDYYPAHGAGFVWVKLKKGRISLSFARGLLRRAGVAVAPGSAFGSEGEGWIRIAANVEGDQLAEGMNRIVRFFHPVKSRLKRRVT